MLSFCILGLLYQDKTSSGGESLVQIQNIWRNKHLQSHQILLLINLAAAVIRGGDLCCRVFLFCDIDC